MMSIVIPLLLVIIIGLVVVLVKVLKSNENTNKELTSSNDNYTALKVISFLFPIIGLIIYAVNIGKNDYLAKEGSKWAIVGMISALIIFILGFIIVTILIPQSTTISGTRY